MNAEMMVAMRKTRRSQHTAWKNRPLFIDGDTSTCRCGWNCQPRKGCRD